MKTPVTPMPATRLSKAVRPAGPVLVTGGAGFVGTNVVDRLAGQGVPVILYDSLVRPGVSENLEWLRQRHGSRIDARIADVRDTARLEQAVREAGTIYHFAAQVAVTTSLVDPAEDFAVNCAATVALLEAVRRTPKPPTLVFTSTNKVYGSLPDVPVLDAGRRCEPADADLRAKGVGEACRMDFHSPYGCSKGAADQYVLDYARCFDLPTVVLRMSCIYGPHQRGNEDQGWVAHFVMRALAGEPITIYGDGRQVRDVLFVDDLVDLMLVAGAPGSPLLGKAVNVGGGPRNAVSLLEVVDALKDLAESPVRVRFGAARPGDQRWYVSDVSRVAAITGWQPRVGVREGLARLCAWLRETRADPARPQLAKAIAVGGAAE